jgi:hypothetical protein
MKKFANTLKTADAKTGEEAKMMIETWANTTGILGIGFA